jgi:hypothetical protein
MRAPDSSKNYKNAESPDWENFQLQIFPQKTSLIDPPCGISQYDNRSCGKSNSPDQLTEYVNLLRRDAKIKKIRQENEILKENIHKKAYLQILCDYPFK